MATEGVERHVHRCECSICREHPRGKVAAEHRAINRLLAVSNERVRRLLAGFLAGQLGRGGVLRLAQITGMDRKTIAKGRCELRENETSTGTGSLSARVRRPGAGRKPVEVRHPGL